MKVLKKLDLEVAIWTMPQGISDPIPFELEQALAPYAFKGSYIQPPR